MSEAVPFTFGATVHCEDGECGELRRVVVDSYSYVISHLVVAPTHRGGHGRLVPVDRVDTSNPHDLQLRATLAQFDSFDDAEESDVVTASTVDVEAQRAEVRTMSRMAGPHVSLGLGLRPERRVVEEDNLQEGEGEIEQGQPVHASDGSIGHVRGLTADPSTHRVTSVLLDEGHLWGEKEVAIPIEAVKFVFDDGVHLKLTKKEVGDLPPVGGAE